MIGNHPLSAGVACGKCLRRTTTFCSIITFSLPFLCYVFGQKPSGHDKRICNVRTLATLRPKHTGDVEWPAGVVWDGCLCVVGFENEYAHIFLWLPDVKKGELANTVTNYNTALKSCPPSVSTIQNKTSSTSERQKKQPPLISSALFFLFHLAFQRPLKRWFSWIWIIYHGLRWISYSIV